MNLYSVLGKCVKVGEGTYGEVYKTNDGVEDVALKVNDILSVYNRICIVN